MTRGRDEEQLLETITELLGDPAHDHNPLREPLARLLELSTAQRERLERLIRISDGFHEIAREEKRGLAEECDTHLRRLERLVRISDRYQESLRELSESLREAALHDPLTGLGNRRYLVERLEAELERCRRNGAPLSLGVLDVDYFKAVNDRLGHERGDRLLCHISDLLADQLREYDLCGRWGGEEFVLVLPETTAEEAKAICDRLRRTIRDTPTPADLAVDRITVSIGISTTEEDPDGSYSAAIDRADRRMLVAKEAGRDRVCGPSL
ncbi:diguanylate cyclase (GGDEF) domain-containing protein [Thiohalospira halophila DSM 15071]|uniref:diguanylate cyclase n=1 Tax=Thiohalospira halophila DSM 15071 TaxID=1123397 RepID=A0A1I1NS08_9GAMM|nr:biofilm regulation diguanylate cyclase SiaD [Thiohalospira halophila]SFD00461.1 diguanylate cyclase (GGDEF) domain-containing protein [Thiohalospira halophila DSM 15071]